MAITPGTSVILQDNSDGATSTVNYTVSGSPSLLVLYYASRGDSLEPTVASDLDGALSLLSGSSQANGTGTTSRRVAIFYLVNPSNGTHVLTITRNGVLQPCAVVNQYAGVDTAAPFGTPVAEVDSDDATSVDASDATGDDLVVDILSTRDTVLPTVGADQTEIANFLIAGGQNVACAHSTQPASTGGVMSWALDGSQLHAHVAVALKAAGGGGPAPIAAKSSYYHLVGGMR
jgi:hypothetical protein